MKWSATKLIPELVDVVVKLGWEEPTTVQELAIPKAVSGRDIIGLSKTGSGKTGAFLLPVLQYLLTSKKQKDFTHSVLILAPSRELAKQIQSVCEELSKPFGIQSALLIGGVDIQVQYKELKRKKIQICVGTPGRVLEYFTRNWLKTPNISHLILDEADKILNENLGPTFESIMSFVQNPKHISQKSKRPLKRLRRRTYLYSATMTTTIHKLQKTFLKNPVFIDVGNVGGSLDKSTDEAESIFNETLRQEWLLVPQQEKPAYLFEVLNSYGGQKSLMVFCSKIKTCEQLYEMLRGLGVSPFILHGNLSQEDRVKNIKAFREPMDASDGVEAKEFTSKVLVCTDVAGRGIDVPHVDVVINYSPPLSSKEYVHRVGRTARAGKTGRSIVFISQNDVELLFRLELLVGKKFLPHKVNQKILQQHFQRAMTAFSDARFRVSKKEIMHAPQLDTRRKSKRKKIDSKKPKRRRHHH